jgi:hypothetical protein
MNSHSGKRKENDDISILLTTERYKIYHSCIYVVLAHFSLISQSGSVLTLSQYDAWAAHILQAKVSLMFGVTSPRIHLC